MKCKPADEIVAFLRPIAEEVGVELVEAEWKGRTRTLTLYIDRPGGVDLVTCEAFHHAVDGPLDELDPTFGAAYTLTCSSAGLDRPFKTQRDFGRHLGERIEVRLYAPQDGKKLFVGTLLACDGETVRIEEEGKERTFPLSAVAKASLEIEV